MPDRFVILHHRTEEGEHWDLMLEQGEVLLTWQLLRDPFAPANYPIPARRIGDHRKLYLTYEGPLSGGRGTVRRVDEGLLRLGEVTAHAVTFGLDGRILRDDFEFRESPSGWFFQQAIAGASAGRRQG